MRIKIFRGFDLFELEDEINTFLEVEPDINGIKTDLHIIPYKDYYEDGRVCNQWTEYSIILNFEVL